MAEFPCHAMLRLRSKDRPRRPRLSDMQPDSCEQHFRDCADRCSKLISCSGVARDVRHSRADDSSRLYAGRRTPYV